MILSAGSISEIQEDKVVIAVVGLRGEKNRCWVMNITRGRPVFIFIELLPLPLYEGLSHAVFKELVDALVQRIGIMKCTFLALTSYEILRLGL
jgi:hypothetical protein